MRSGGGSDRINGNLETSVGTVLESDYGQEDVSQWHGRLVMRGEDGLGTDIPEAARGERVNKLVAYTRARTRRTKLSVDLGLGGCRCKTGSAREEHASAASHD